MHSTALTNCQQFFDCYTDSIRKNAKNARVIEIGSQDVNGSIRHCSPSEFEYVGVDFVSGNGVDLILDDPYALPFESESVDVVLSSSCFEHSEMFWLVFLEVMRILKPTGLFYLNAPSNGKIHRHPVDCWRFYPDSGNALVTWAKRNGMNPELLESYTNKQATEGWNDYVAVFLKDREKIMVHPNRIVEKKSDFRNGLITGNNEFINKSELPEDMLKLSVIKKIIDNKITIT